ncbi:MAG: hypothetical protein AMJ68_09115 [Acidithiobacillales bacterium SG8_45]|jgi:hypothetical protein|nr:MAG: hypothetical protein AMJ68_09115 [Acidithiobacillales bacterium SG8_45]
MYLRWSVALGGLLALSACVFVRAPTPDELALLDNPPVEIRQKQDQLAPLALRWVNQVETKLLDSGRRLSEQEIAIARTVDVQYPERVRVVVLSAFPLPENETLLAEARRYGLGSNAEGGRTMGYVIMLKERFAKKRWIMAHELVHVAQQEKMGREPFLRRLMTEYELMGYRRAPLELEANKRALDFM